MSGLAISISNNNMIVDEGSAENAITIVSTDLNMRASTCLGIVAVSCVSTVKDMPEGSL
jgi:hypothetical protein